MDILKLFQFMNNIIAILKKTFPIVFIVLTIKIVFTWMCNLVSSGNELLLTIGSVVSLFVLSFLLAYLEVRNNTQEDKN